MLDDVRVTLFPGAVLRSMQSEDIEAVVELERLKAVPGQAVCPRGVFKARLLWPGMLNLIVEMQGSVVGFAVFRLTGDKADWLKVVSDAKGHPLGSRVISVVMTMLREKGFTHIVGRCPQTLQPYYERLGARCEGIMPHFFGAEKHAIALKWTL